MAANIFEIQEEIIDVEEEVEGLKNLISTNNLDVDLTEYNKAVNLAKEVLANGDIPNAQAKLALANEIKSDLYNQINEIVVENQDEKINEFVQKSISNIEELLSKGENLGLTKKAISELEDTLAALKSGDIEESLDKTSEKSKFANEIKENKEAEKELKAEEKAAEKELKAEEKNNDKPKEIPNGLGAAGDNPSENGFDNGQGLGLGKIPPGIAKLFGYDEGDIDKNKAEEKELKAEEKAAEKESKSESKDRESKEIPNGLGAAGDNPSENGFDNGQGLGLGNIPPGLARFDSFEESFSSSPDDYFENHFEAKFEAKFEKSFDDTKKGNGNGKGLLGDAPGKSGEAPGQNKEKKSSGKSNNGNGNDKKLNDGITDTASGSTCGVVNVLYTVQGFTAIKNGNDATSSIKIDVGITPPKYDDIKKNEDQASASFTPLSTGTYYITASVGGLSDVIRIVNIQNVCTTTAPGAVTSLVATATSSSQINLVWVAPVSNGGSAITGYKIERASPTGGAFSVLVADTTTTSLTYSNTGLASSTQYNYRVSAINAIGTGSPSNEDDATTQAAGGGGNNTPTVTSGGIPDVSKSGNNQDTVINLGDYFADVEDTDNQMTYTITSNTFTGQWDTLPENSISGTMLTLDFKNGSQGDGTGTITVRATDTGGLFVEDTFTVTRT